MTLKIKIKNSTGVIATKKGWHFDAGCLECEMLNETYNFTSKLEENCMCLFLPMIYHKHYWIMSVKRPHEEVTV